MLREFPHFYGDNSALVSLNRCAHVRECASVELESRILHGSDFPVPALGHRLRLHGWINRETFHRVKKIANPLERDWQFKVALGFPEESRTRVTNILRMPKSSS